MELSANLGCPELSIVVFDLDPENGDSLVGELGYDCILQTLKVKNMREEWLDMDYCSKVDSIAGSVFAVILVDFDKY